MDVRREFGHPLVGDMGIIPPTISPIPLKYSRGRPHKNLNIIVFL